MKSKPRTHCIVCGKRKVIPKKLQQGVTRGEFEADPYCSRECCEADQAKPKQEVA